MFYKFLISAINFLCWLYANHKDVLNLKYSQLKPMRILFLLYKVMQAGFSLFSWFSTLLIFPYKSSLLYRVQGTNIKPFMQSKTAWKVVSTPDTPAVWQQGDTGGEEIWTRGWHFQNPSQLPHFQWKLQGIWLATVSEQKCHEWKKTLFSNLL